MFFDKNAFSVITIFGSVRAPGSETRRWIPNASWQNAPKPKNVEVTFETFLRNAVALTVDTFNRIDEAKDDRIYDVVKLQVTVKRMNLSQWVYDRLDMVLRETNCTKKNVTKLEDCVVATDPNDCTESTDRSKPLNKQPHFGSSFTKTQQVKFDKYLRGAINLAVDTFNKIGNVKEGNLYDVVLIKTTVKRIDTDVWIYERLEMTLRETNCTKIDNEVSLDGCVIVHNKEPDQSCRYQVSTGQINGSQILGCSGVV
ncbi:hypothetical protein GE061_007275 [Apolygus lucorum]|uniref:Cystatin domain-containing protein n=1 Tax=Apolygus lucorum TaxID=248454 RepID=A0A8S9WQQ2_APOLU|nr:hypothetical protein GE061_007275 [Apolygus lucorum]